MLFPALIGVLLATKNTRKNGLELGGRVDRAITTPVLHPNRGPVLTLVLFPVTDVP